MRERTWPTGKTGTTTKYMESPSLWSSGAFHDLLGEWDPVDSYWIFCDKEWPLYVWYNGLLRFHRGAWCVCVSVLFHWLHLAVHAKRAIKWKSHGGSNMKLNGWEVQNVPKYQNRHLRSITSHQEVMCVIFFLSWYFRGNSVNFGGMLQGIYQQESNDTILDECCSVPGCECELVAGVIFVCTLGCWVSLLIVCIGLLRWREIPESTIYLRFIFPSLSCFSLSCHPFWSFILSLPLPFCSSLSGLSFSIYFFLANKRHRDNIFEVFY